MVLGAQYRAADQRQSRITYRIGAFVAVRAAAEPEPRAVVPTGRLTGLLSLPSLPVTAVLVALVLAALLGALHALTPGHAKTLLRVLQSALPQPIKRVEQVWFL
ncbi:hypothetical protein, partial [Actinoplanes couchii]|uniref:hypothetical protein n=1 Tax=Actinoplanes couchii TaxID=403638 RepID=UPI001944D7A2